MRIGIDLDNTLICYDGLFHALGREQGWLDDTVPANKHAVRSAILTLRDGDAKWQYLQGKAYGPRLGEAAFFPGAHEALAALASAGHELFVISHKTVYSGIGGYDLHAAALGFLRSSRLFAAGLLREDAIFFRTSRVEKIRTIAALGCRICIDDLGEVLTHPEFPASVRKIHFCPDAGAESPPGVLVVRSWDEIAQYDPELDDTLTDCLGEPVRRLHRAPGGRNSRAWQAALGGRTATRLFVKQYAPPALDTRDRLGVESGAFSFLHDHGVHCVPRVVAVAPEKNTAVYEWIDGTVVKKLPEVPGAVAPFVGFVRTLWTLSRTLSECPEAAAEAAGNASEAFLSLEALRQQITFRLDRLLRVPEDDAGTAAMQAFLRQTIVPLWNTVWQRALHGYAGEGRSPDAELPLSERILSPSDFGYHNALRRADGEWVFVDFEYFGWDDPVKVMADFLVHPGMALSARQRKEFLDGVLPLFSGSQAARRLALVQPLFAIRWICIMLNEFLPPRSTTRHFTAGRTSLDEARTTQLAKARALYQNELEHETCHHV